MTGSATPDPAAALARVRRIVALRQAGQPVPVELEAWLTGCLASIAAGEPADIALGLRPEPGQRSPLTVAAYRRRDAAIAELFARASGAQVRRGETVLQWLDDPPPAVAELVREVEAAGIPAPEDARTVARIVSRAGRELPELAP